MDRESERQRESVGRETEREIQSEDKNREAPGGLFVRKHRNRPDVQTETAKRLGR